MQADAVASAILANFNKQRSRAAMYRALFTHADWRGGGTGEFRWIASGQDSPDALAKSLREDLIGDVTSIAQLDDHVAGLPDLELFKIDPCGPLSPAIDAIELIELKRFARGHRAERAIAERDHPRVRDHPTYFVPFIGVLGHEHQLIVLPTPRGNMLAAFTTGDAREAFLATGSADHRAKVQFVAVAGDELFGNASQMAQGVVVNVAGPQPYGLDLDTCADIAR
jgi:hypothetical protein